MVTTSEVSGEPQGTEIVVQRTVPYPVKTVWGVLMSDDGAENILGPGAHFGAKGEKWSAQDGREGVIRSFHPMEQIRFSWRVSEKHKPAIVSLKLSGEADSTTIEIKHQQPEPVHEENWLVERWEAALDRLESDCL